MHRNIRKQDEQVDRELDIQELIKNVRKLMASTKYCPSLDISLECFQRWYLVLRFDDVDKFLDVKNKSSKQELWILLSVEFNYDCNTSGFRKGFNAISSQEMLRERSGFKRPLSLLVAFQCTRIIHHLLHTSYFSQLVLLSDIGNNNILHIMSWVASAKSIDDEFLIPLCNAIMGALDLKTKHFLMFHENSIEVIMYHGLL